MLLHVADRRMKATPADQPHRTWLPEHSEAMSVMGSLCSSRTSDSVMLLPLLGTSNTRIAPFDTPGGKGRDVAPNCTKTFWNHESQRQSSRTHLEKYSNIRLLLDLKKKWIVNSKLAHYGSLLYTFIGAKPEVLSLQFVIRCVTEYLPTQM